MAGVRDSMAGMDKRASPEVPAFDPNSLPCPFCKAKPGENCATTCAFRIRIVTRGQKAAMRSAIKRKLLLRVLIWLVAIGVLELIYLWVSHW